MLKFHSDIASVNCTRCSTCLEQFPGMKRHVMLLNVNAVIGTSMSQRMCLLKLKNMVRMVIVDIKFAPWMVT